MNKFQFMGRLTKEVETRSTTTGTAVANFDIAVNRKFSNEQVKADFFKITTFGKTAEFVSKYFDKGRQVLVEGRIQNRSWEDEHGNKRYATDFIAEQVYFADSKQESNTVGNTSVDTTDFITLDETERSSFLKKVG